jgi:broad specificity phosphatase PhoE
MARRPEPAIVIVRHGATEWSEAGRHTSRTNLPLLPEGVERAQSLARTLDPASFALVLCSPSRRAQQTAQLAGFGARIEICNELTEWNYGDYEGLTTPQIHARRPGWNLWRQGAPGGEMPGEVAARVDRVIERACDGDGDAILFAHGHVLRVLAARWLGESAEFGSRLDLFPATISKLGHEHERRVIERWNADAP